MRKFSQLLAITACLLVIASANAQQGPTRIARAANFAVSAPLKDLPSLIGGKKLSKRELKELNEKNEIPLKRVVPGYKWSPDGALDKGVNAANFISPLALNAPAVAFDGLNYAGAGSVGAPPDVNGEVGPNHYVQAVNSAIRVWDKAGNPLIAPIKLGTLFSALGAPFTNINDGDPIVLYDQMADRWLVSEFCISVANPNNHQLIAISKTGDPTGQWYLYDFMMPNNKFNDYPHFGIWPDGYYMSDNQFNQAGTAFLGAGAFAYDRSKMLIGDPTASYIYFDVYNICPSCGGELPSDIDGLTTPPAGMGNLFMEYRSNDWGDPYDGLRIFEFKADFTTPANSTFTQLSASDLPLSSFNVLTTQNTNVQPGTTTKLDNLGDRLMHRLAYRNLGSKASPVNSWVLNFTVEVGTAGSGKAGVRWVELRRPGAAGVISVNQEGTFSPDGTIATGGLNRWMGSIAQNYRGDIVLGYTTSGSTAPNGYPTVRYTGRLVTDPAGTMPQGEQIAGQGAGSQINNLSRWGDYSAMSVDPNDDCSFWYTQQYQLTTGSFNWVTRIAGGINFSGTCTPAPKGSIAGVVTYCSSGNPVPNATVTITGGYFRQSNATGNYSANVVPDTYTVTVSSPGLGTVTVPGVVVTDGNTTTVNVCLVGVPVIVAGSKTLTAESCAPANSNADPGETVTYSLCLNNTGGGNTSNLVATLLATGGVVSPSAPQTYGAIPAGGGTMCKDFSFTTSGSCGGAVTLTLDLMDGATSLGTVSYTITLGSISTTNYENFDALSVPALPSGWAATNTQGTGTTWVSSNAGNPLPVANSLPNSLWVDDPATVSNKEVVTPTITGPVSISFQTNYNLENTFDGGVLEISVNGGAFQDIIAAGGSFVTGGYNATISSNFSSPIAGRQAWTGNSSGFKLVTVNLPASAIGQPVVLKWRMASDNSTVGTGWRIDDISFTSPSCCVSAPVCTLTCPANITVNATSGLCGANVTYPAPGTTGTCGTVTATPASGSFFPVGTTTVNVSSSTGATCSFTITVVDAESPTITCPANITVNNTTGVCGAVVTYSLPTVADNCTLPGGALVQTGGLASGSTFPVGVTTNTFRVTDAVGNQTTCSFTVTVNDTQAPTITCPANITVSNSPGQCSAVVNYSLPAVSDNCTLPGGALVQTGGLPSGSNFPVGVTTNTFRVTDASGNQTTCSFTVTVNDTQAPSIVCPANITASNSPGQCSATVSFSLPTAIDNCPGGSVVAVPASGSVFPVGTTTVTITATDAAGNTASCSFTVTVNDTQAPTITCPANINVCGGSQVVNYTLPTATDNCSGVSVVSIPASGSVFPVGTTTVTATATDASGNTASCTFTVTVNPVVDATATPSSQTICSANPITSIVLSGSVSGTTYSWTRNNTGSVTGIAASGTGDISGTLTNTTNAPVTVTFTITPSANGCTGTPITATVLVNPTPNAVATPSAQTVCSNIAITPIVLTGNVSGTTYTWTRNNTVNVTGIAASGSGNISGTMVNNTGVQQVVTFTITPSANGCAGTPITATVTLNVPPTITCPANISVNNTLNQCGAIVNYPPATATGFPVPVITYSQASGTFFPVGTTIVTATATNSCGTASCTFTVTVVDTQAPTIVCPSNITVNNTANICGANVNYPFPTVGDNCALPGGTPVSLSQTTNNTTIIPIQIGCQAGGLTTENSWWRAYNLAPLNLPAGLSIKNVNFGIEKITGGPVPITARIWISNGAFPASTRTLAGQATATFAVQANTFGTISFPSAILVPSNAIVVVELNCPDQRPNGRSFFIGSNNLGESAPSYLSATACGVPNPTEIATLVPNPLDHIILNINAEYYTSAPTLVQIAGLPSGGLFPVGTTTNTFRATDAAGNQSTCSFTVTVNDTQAPVVSCPANIVRNTDAGVCTASVAVPNPTYSDNCAVTQLTWTMTGATVASSPATGINFVGTRTFNLNGTTGTGVTTIIYTARDAAGNTTSCSFTVTVNDAVRPQISGQPATRFTCVGSNAQFAVAATSNGGPLAYQWQEWNGTAWVNVAGATSSSFAVNSVSFTDNTRSFRVILTGLCTVVTSDAATLYVNPLPTVSLTTSIPPILSPAQSMNINAVANPAGGNYVWSFNGTVVPGRTGSSWNGVTVDGIGTYRVTYTDPNGCTSSSADLVVSGLQSDGLWVYPNPNNGQFTVRYYNQLNEKITVNVYDSKGARIFQQLAIGGTAYTAVEVSLGNQFAAGVYIVQAVNGEGKIVGSRRIILRHR